MFGFFEWLGNLIKSIFNFFFGFVIDLWDLFWGVCCAVGNWICAGFEYVWDWVIFGFYCAFDWILCIFVDILEKLSLIISIPIDFQSLQPLIPYIQMCDIFLPIRVFVACVIVYTSVLMTWVTYKFVKSWIPTVSGT